MAFKSSARSGSVTINTGFTFPARAWQNFHRITIRFPVSAKDLKEVKRVFVGEDKKAIMVFPPESEHVNIHPNCLHLYAPLGEDPLPDFSKEGSI